MIRPTDLLKRLEERPFKAFRIHLSDGTSLDVPEAGMVIVGRTTAVLPSAFAEDEDGARVAEHWRTIALVHITQFSDLDDKTDGRRRRKRP